MWCMFPAEMVLVPRRYIFNDDITNIREIAFMLSIVLFDGVGYCRLLIRCS